MFRAPTERFRSWMARVDEALDDVLGDPLVDEEPHPHRTPLRWRYDRRQGSVAPRPAQCLSPVHSGGGVRQVDHAER